MIKDLLFSWKGKCIMSIQLYPSRFFHGIIWVFCMGLLGCSAGVQSNHDPAPPKASDLKSPFYSFKLTDIDGWPIALSRYEGKVLLVVNVASECRFTNQYANLQRLYMKYRDQGFVVLGFPANNFGNQETGTNAEIKEFTTRQFNILFPLFSKISVKGEDIHPLYQCLTSHQTDGEFGGPITWNFNKFLIDKDGTTIARFPSEIDPLDPQITEAVEAALQ
jgi:glutathione peroxidase-family protein